MVEVAVKNTPQLTAICLNAAVIVMSDATCSTTDIHICTYKHIALTSKKILNLHHVRHS